MYEHRWQSYKEPMLISDYRLTYRQHDTRTAPRNNE